MSNLRTRVISLEDARQQRQGSIVVCVLRGETEEQALARAGITPTALHSSRLYVLVNRFCYGDDTQNSP